MATDQPPVAELLDVDREYRDKAAAGELRRIAPRRFPSREEAWLPILQTQRGERQYTVLFAHTTRAHRWSKTRDGVVLYYDGGHAEQQYTVVTSQLGPLTGKRVVSGRAGGMASLVSSLSGKAINASTISSML